MKYLIAIAVIVSLCLMPQPKIKLDHSPDLDVYVQDYMKFLKSNKIDRSNLKDCRGIFSTTRFDTITNDGNILGATRITVPDDSTMATFTKCYVTKVEDSVLMKVLVFHELTHALTKGGLPHCHDRFNCSSIFAPYVQGLEYRYHKYWDLEEAKLANMIKTYQEFSD